MLAWSQWGSCKPYFLPIFLYILANLHHEKSCYISLLLAHVSTVSMDVQTTSPGLLLIQKNIYKEVYPLDRQHWFQQCVYQNQLFRIRIHFIWPSKFTRTRNLSNQGWSWSYLWPHRDQWGIHSWEERVGVDRAIYKKGKHTQTNTHTYTPFCTSSLFLLRPWVKGGQCLTHETDWGDKDVKLSYTRNKGWIMLKAYRDCTACTCVGIKHWIQYCLRWTWRQIRNPIVPLILGGW